MMAAVRPQSRLELLALAVAAAVACDQSAQPAAASAAVIDTLAGVEYVRNPEAAERWTLREIARIGGTDEGPGAFSRVRSIIADAGGAIYVGDFQTSEIRVFDERGNHLRTLGRKGTGPGEFDAPYSLAWLGDTLMVLDPGNGRVQLLTARGEWVGQLPAPRASGDPRLFQTGIEVVYWGFGAAGDYYVRYSLSPDPSERGMFDPLKYGVWADTLTALPRPPPASGAPGGRIRCEQPRRGATHSFRLPDLPESFRIPAPNGLVGVASSPGVRVTFLTRTADTARVVERAYERVRVTDDDWVKATAPYRRFVDTARGLTCTPSSYTRPEFKASIRGLDFDVTGRMWVAVMTDDGLVYDVFDSTGRQLGRAPAPMRQLSVPLYARGDRLYLMQADSLGVQSVVVYAIER